MTRIDPMRIAFADGSPLLNANLFPTIYGVHPRHGRGAQVGFAFFDGHIEQTGDYFVGGYNDWIQFPWAEP